MFGEIVILGAENVVLNASHLRKIVLRDVDIHHFGHTSHIKVGKQAIAQLCGNDVEHVPLPIVNGIHPVVFSISQQKLNER